MHFIECGTPTKYPIGQHNLNFLVVVTKRSSRGASAAARALRSETLRFARTQLAWLVPQKTLRGNSILKRLTHMVKLAASMPRSRSPIIANGVDGARELPTASIVQSALPNSAKATAKAGQGSARMQRLIHCVSIGGSVPPFAGSRLLSATIVPLGKPIERWNSYANKP